jgi:hypothetical protein
VVLAHPATSISVAAAPTRRTENNDADIVTFPVGPW